MTNTPDYGPKKQADANAPGSEVPNDRPRDGVRPSQGPESAAAKDFDVVGNETAEDLVAAGSVAEAAAENYAAGDDAKAVQFELSDADRAMLAEKFKDRDHPVEDDDVTTYEDLYEN